VAVAHSLLVIIYHLLKKPGTSYRDLGPEYLDKLQSKQLKSHLVRRLEGLGYRVSLEQVTEAEGVAQEPMDGATVAYAAGVHSP
jgi:hypothetical protein